MAQRTVNLPIYVHPDARIDALEAYFWYEERSNEVAQAFRSELDAAVKSIAVSPESWPSYLYSTQRFVMKRFPFAVIYRIANTRIEILAVAHGRRKPGYWRNRR